MSATCGTGEQAFWAWRIHGNTLQALVLARLSALSRKATAYTKTLYSQSEPASRKAWPLYTRLHVVVRHVYAFWGGIGKLADEAFFLPPACRGGQSDLPRKRAGRREASVPTCSEIATPANLARRTIWLKWWQRWRRWRPRIGEKPTSQGQRRQRNNRGNVWKRSSRRIAPQSGVSWTDPKARQGSAGTI